MSKQEVVDARNGEHVKVPGKVLKTLIRERITALEKDYNELISRMNNETKDKETAIGLMVALGGGGNLNHTGLFFKACVERAAWIEKEIRELNTVGVCFADSSEVYYQISVQDAVRYGV